MVVEFETTAKTKPGPRNVVPKLFLESEKGPARPPTIITGKIPKHIKSLMDDAVIYMDILHDINEEINPDMSKSEVSFYLGLFADYYSACVNTGIAIGNYTDAAGLLWTYKHDDIRVQTGIGFMEAVRQYLTRFDEVYKQALNLDNRTPLGLEAIYKRLGGGRL